jgi:hypothetical protein
VYKLVDDAMSSWRTAIYDVYQQRAQGVRM